MMSGSSPDTSRPGLTPAQAAYAIRELYAIENRRAIEGNWRRSQSALGRVAIHTLRATGDREIDERLHLPLTVQEMGAGLKHIEEELQQPATPPEVVKGWPVEPTEEEWEKINKLTDNRGFPLEQAYAAVMGVWPN